jgi:uncharacterized protein YbcI
MDSVGAGRRGATTARTIIERNYVVCFLEDIYTPVERTLIGAGRLDVVRDTRNLFQDAMGPRFIEAVAAATGRKLIAFMSQGLFRSGHGCRGVRPRAAR